MRAGSLDTWADILFSCDPPVPSCCWIELSAMAYLIGTDEAGYGPFLGPLVIATSVWQVPDLEVDLRDHFGGETGTFPEDVSLPVVIDDSKRVFKRQRGLGTLEHTVLPALATTLPGSGSPASWRSLWHQLAPGSEKVLNELPWYQDFDVAIPTGIEAAVVDEVTEQLRSFWKRVNVRLLRLQAVALFPPQFNEEVEQYGGKGELLTRQTLDLVRRQVSTLEGEPILIQCDKHGGRNYYGPALQEAFPEYLVEVRRESRAQSVYRWGPPEQRTEICFTAKGDSFLPAALASMAAKYLRELAMQAFNAYWCERLPSLQPTAGYPADARRFKEEIAQVQAAEKISDAILWRNR